jgi:integrase
MEAKYLAAASENLRDAATILLDTGLRPQSELFVLEWPNVELSGRPETPNGVVHIRGGKSDAAKRSVRLTTRAADVLRRRKAEADALPEGEHSSYVFPGDGNTGHLVSLQHPHRDAIGKAKLDWFALYSLRHTFGTRCAESGMDKYTLARLMGHSSPSITARYYVHVTESHVTAGFEKFATYQERGVAEGIAKAFPEATAAVQ